MNEEDAQLLDDVEQLVGGQGAENSSLLLNRAESPTRDTAYPLPVRTTPEQIKQDHPLTVDDVKVDAQELQHALVRSLRASLVPCCGASPCVWHGTRTHATVACGATLQHAGRACHIRLAQFRRSICLRHVLACMCIVWRHASFQDHV